MDGAGGGTLECNSRGWLLLGLRSRGRKLPRAKREMERRAFGTDRGRAAVVSEGKLGVL